MRRVLAIAVATLSLAGSSPASASEPAVLTVWESGGLRTATLAAVGHAAAVGGGSLSIVHTGTLRMMSVTRGEDYVQRPAEGFGYPMATTAVAPSDSTQIDPELEPVLRRGQVVMSIRSAALRGAEVGDTIELEGWNGELAAIRIGAVVDDPRLDWAELVIPVSVASRLEFDRPAIAIVSGGDGGVVRAAFEAMAPAGPILVGRPGEPITFTEPTLPTVTVKERFGEFAFRRTGVADGIEIERAWLEANIVDVSMPVIGPFKCNRAVVPYIRAAVAELIETGAIDAIDRDDFQLAGGCFNSRLMRGGDKGFALSRHAWGIAIDFNPSTNRYGHPVTLDPEVAAIMRSWGFAWGGMWTVPDGMHFEWTRMTNRVNCARVTVTGPATSAATWQVSPRAEPCS